MDLELKELLMLMPKVHLIRLELTAKVLFNKKD